MSADSLHSEENEALGSEFCSGYIDSMGKWNNGFYCPGESTEEQFCCGSATFKYCCPKREQVVTEDTSRLPLLLGVMFGVVTAIIMITMMLCCFCSCCILYKKRQPPANGGPLYRMHCSSTASGVANMYSFSNPNSLATPLDAAVASARLLVDLEQVVASHTAVPAESRTSMPRGHTFSRETRPIAMDLNVSELGEISDRVPGIRTGLLSPEPPPPYNSTRDEQRPDSVVQAVSHGTSFCQRTFNLEGSAHPSTGAGLQTSLCVISQTSGSGTAQIESQLPPVSRTFTNTGTTSAASSTFIPSSTTEVTATEQITSNTSVVVQPVASGVGPVLLSASSTPPLSTTVTREHDALYHSTKF